MPEDDSPVPVRSKPETLPKRALWPLLLIFVGLIATLAWIGGLGWLALRLIAWLLG